MKNPKRLLFFPPPSLSESPFPFLPLKPFDFAFTLESIVKRRVRFGISECFVLSSRERFSMEHEGPFSFFESSKVVVALLSRSISSDANERRRSRALGSRFNICITFTHRIPKRIPNSHHLDAFPSFLKRRRTIHFLRSSLCCRMIPCLYFIVIRASSVALNS